MQKLSFNVAECVAASGMSRSRIYRAMASGELPFRYAGCTRIIKGEDLSAFIDNLPEGVPNAPRRDVSPMLAGKQAKAAAGGA